MKHWILILLILPIAQSVFADSGGFAEGDYLFIKAQVVDCGPEKRFVEVGIVEESGQVTLFDEIVLETKGKTNPEIATQLVDELERRTSKRPESIEILQVPANNPKKAAQLMIMVYEERKPGCRKKLVPDDQLRKKEWFRIANDRTHNKAHYPFRPAASTRTQLRCAV